MIIYQENKTVFLRDALERDIEEVVRHAYVSRRGSAKGVSSSEFAAWKESLLQMAKVVRDDGIPSNAGVAIEYHIPGSSKRIDFVLTGRDASDRSTAVIVELKRWSDSQPSDKDSMIIAYRGGKAVAAEGTHPSYQAWTYAQLLTDLNSAIEEGKVRLKPCAYLHNHPPNGVIDGPAYASDIERAPLFLKGDLELQRLQNFIARHVRTGDNGNLLYRIEGGEIRPSRALSDCVASMIEGNPEFALIDEQKLIFETARQSALTAALPGTAKRVVIVRGGPGTGKSVVAVQLLATLLNEGLNTRYVTRNAAPRAVYRSKLAGSRPKSRIEELFTGSSAFMNSEPDDFHALIVDEAHRLTQFSGLYKNLGENQVMELIQAARCTVFFVDDDQRVTIDDIGTEGEIREWALKFDAEITTCQLKSQFRCGGSNDYAEWVDETLGLAEFGQPILDVDEFDFRVVDSASELHELIRERNQERNRARVVAGYCWNWVSKKNPNQDDIVLDNGKYRKKWNLASDGSLWAIAEGSIEEVGCIHTVQGLELDYVGVIIGRDLIENNGALETDASARARSDQSLRGLKKLQQQDAADAARVADRVVRNTYRTLLTRGMRGCYVYCVDPGLAEFIRGRLSSSSELSSERSAKVIQFPIVHTDDRTPEREYAPILTLQAAAGAFGAVQDAGAEAEEWIELGAARSADRDLFVVQIVGESMNLQIPNGAYCLFKSNPAGTREGRVVLAQHHAIEDPESSGSFTVKVYSSTKVADADGTWRHSRIELRPDSDRPDFAPIVIEANQQAEEPVRIVGELIEVLGMR